MSEFFMLEPDDIEPERPERSRVRMVATGLAPTEDVPRNTRQKPPQPCYGPCPRCGAQVLCGDMPGGVPLMLDTSLKSYVVRWPQHTDRPALTEGQGYPAHRCAGEED